MSNEKDILERSLLSYPDVFADAINTGVFDGRRVVHSDDLEPVKVHSLAIGTDGMNTREQIRDTAMLWKSAGVIYAVLGIENQTKPDPLMPLRVLSYDGAAYFEQVQQARKNPGFKPYPVITITLNYSLQPWTVPRTLYGALGLSGPQPMSDYRIIVVDLANLSKDLQDKMDSDLRVVSSVLSSIRSKDMSFINSIRTSEFDHPEVTGRTISALLQGGIAMPVDLDFAKQFHEQWLEILREREISRQEGQNDILTLLMKKLNCTRQEAIAWLRGESGASGGISQMRL